MSDVREVHHAVTRGIVDEACARTGVALDERQRQIMAAKLRGERVYLTAGRRGWAAQRVGAQIAAILRAT